MAKKQQKPQAPRQPKLVAPVEIAPLASMAMSYFMKVNEEAIGREKGGVNIKTTTDSLLFKIDDIISIVDTTDGFLVITLKPSGDNKFPSQFTFNKLNVEMMFVDFDQPVRYMSERERPPPGEYTAFYS